MPEGVVGKERAKAHEELAIPFYNAARAEIVQRLALREQIFLAWITATGVILGFAAKTINQGHLFEPHLVLVIPILSLPLSLAFYRHQLIIAYLGRYLTTDLRDFLYQNDPDAPRHWDTSIALGSRTGRFLLVEAVAFTLVLSGVPAACLIYLALSRQLSVSAGWYWTGWGCTAASAFVGVAELVRLKRLSFTSFWRKKKEK